MVHAGIPFRILDLIFWQTFMNIVQGLVKVYEKFVPTRFPALQLLFSIFIKNR